MEEEITHGHALQHTNHGLEIQKVKIKNKKQRTFPQLPTMRQKTKIDIPENRTKIDTPENRTKIDIPYMFFFKNNIYR